MDNNNNNFLASAIESARFDIINEPLILIQIINPTTPSISSISNNILCASIENTTKECYHLSDHKCKDDDGTCSNDYYGLSIADASYFVDDNEKDDATMQHAPVTLDRKEIACRTCEWTLGTK